MKIHYVSGSRADFGLMERSLQAIRDSSGLEIELVLTGQALIQRYGDVSARAAEAGLPVVHRIPVRLEGGDRIEMARAFAGEVTGFTEFWAINPPDLVLVLGDRGEMLAATACAFNLGIPIAHIHGGERSGSIDDGFRHAISKLATYHLVANGDSAERLERMGEARERIVNVGAPGLVGLTDGIECDRAWLVKHFDLDPDAKVALVLFHPVVTEGDAGRQFDSVLSAALATGFQTIILRPNSDSGGASIDAAIDLHQRSHTSRVIEHLDRQDYLRVLASCDVLLGNSSSGIIESASLNTACVNVGSRQDGRLRNKNTIDCPKVEAAPIAEALNRATRLAGPFENVYGDGQADRLIVEALHGFANAPAPMQKTVTY